MGIFRRFGSMAGLVLAVASVGIAQAGTPALDITTTSLPAGMEAVPYSHTLTSVGGTPPLEWTVAKGFLEETATNSFAFVGTGQGFQADDFCWGPIALPFPFPFYGNLHTQCFVNTKGVIRFDECDQDFSASEAELAVRPMIAVFWGDWLTNLEANPVEDIYIEAEADRVTIRWQGEIFGGGSVVNFSATLVDDGSILLKYGDGNLEQGMVGVSEGNGNNYLLVQNSGQARSNTPDIRLTPVSPLPEGLSLSPAGVLSGFPVQAATNNATFLVRDALGTNDFKVLSVTIHPNPNRPPVLSSTSPAVGLVELPTAIPQLFEVNATDPEAQPLSYSWRWDGAPRGGNSASLNLTSTYAEFGTHTLECVISDGVWTGQVRASWQVVLLEDNDGDGATNLMELDLGRDPNDAGDGGDPSSIAGRVTGLGLPLAGAEIALRGATGTLFHQTVADDDGNYIVQDVQPGQYHVKAGAGGFADEWLVDASHRTNSTALTVAAASAYTNIDFQLQPGQNAILIEVTSTPSGAAIYLNHLPTGLLTPAVVEVGEAPGLSHATLAPHVITVKKSGSPDPAPRVVDAREAETVAEHFDLTQPGSGSVAISSSPSGASIFFDTADTGRGVTPFTLTNVQPGEHVLFLRRTGRLIPRPIRVLVPSNGTAQVTFPLAALNHPNQFAAQASSMPTNAPVSVDGRASGLFTNGEIAVLDGSDRSDTDWYTADHVLSASLPGFLPTAPRYVRPGDLDPAFFLFRLPNDPGADTDGDQLPDAWENAWNLAALAPGQHGTTDDPDQDHATNEQELKAGTNPLDGLSVLRLDATSGPLPGAATYAFHFATIPGQYYVVERADNLIPGWTPVGTVISATGPLTTVFLEITGTNLGFFRASVVTP